MHAHRTLRCTNCKKAHATHGCRRCATPYCGKACQREHWEDGTHRSECSIIAAGGGTDEDPEKLLIGSRIIPAYRIVPKDKRDESDKNKTQDVAMSHTRGSTYLVGVFDGHDESGHFAATEAARIFGEDFNALPDTALDTTDWFAWLESTTDKVQKHLLESMEMINEEGGTTVVAAVIHKGKIYSGSVGDAGMALLDTWTQDGAVVVASAFWPARPSSDPPIVYPAGDGKQYSSSRLDALGHVSGSRHFKSQGASFYQGKFVRNSKMRLEADKVMLMGSDGFFDLFDALQKQRTTSAPSGSAKRSKKNDSDDDDYGDDDEYGTYKSDDDDDDDDVTDNPDDESSSTSDDDPNRESVLDANLRECYNVHASKMSRKLGSKAKKLWRKLWESDETQKEDITVMVVKLNTPVDKLDKV